MEHNPAEIIRQARQKAEKAMMETCGEEIQRICEAFSYDTGLCVTGIYFKTLDVTTFGSARKETVMCGVEVAHEGA